MTILFRDESFVLDWHNDVASRMMTAVLEESCHLRDSVRAVRDAISDSRLVQFDGVGHNGPLAAIEAVTDDMQTVRAEFLAQDESVWVGLLPRRAL